MEFKVRKKTFLKSKDNTTNIMYSILVILVLFILFATYKNGIYPTIKGYGSLYLLFKPLIFSSIGAVVCLLKEIRKVFIIYLHLVMLLYQGYFLALLFLLILLYGF